MVLKVEQVVSRQYLVPAVSVHHNLIRWVVRAESVTMSHLPHLEELRLMARVVITLAIVPAVAVAVLVVPQVR